MKKFTTAFCLFLLILSTKTFAQTPKAGDYRSIASGNWSAPATWETFNGTTWNAASAAPLATNTVFIQAAHVVNIDVPVAACDSLHINTAASTTVAIGANTLEVNGKLRAYTGTAGTIPGTSTNTLPSTAFITTAAGGKLKLVGLTRNITFTGEWAANPPIWSVDFALNAGETGTLGPGFKAGDITISSGTLTCNSGLRVDSNATGTGKLTIKNGAILKVGNNQALQRINTASATSHFNTLNLESGGTLEFGTGVGVIGALNINFAGTVLYSSTTAQTLVTKGGNTAGVDPNIYTNLTLQSSAKTLALNTTVNGILSMRTSTGNAPSLALGGFVLTYGPASVLQYRGIGSPIPAQTTGSAEWPDAGSGFSMPNGIDIFNQSNVTLNANKSIAGEIKLSGTSGISAKILLGAFNLAAGSLNIATNDGSKYIVTDGVGALTLPNVGNTAVLFPVGPSSTLYHPATITNAGTPDNFSVNVASANPVCATTASDWVTATWNIAEAVAGGSNCTLNLNYTGAATGGTYNLATAKIAHCNGATVDYENGSVTGTTATGAGFTSFSPFGIKSTPAIAIDMSATGLVAPTNGGCKTNAEPVTIAIKNNGASTINFSVNPVTVTATATGGYNSVAVLTSGTLAAGASQNVTMPATIDMSAGGTFTFNANTVVVGDGNTGNDAMVPATITASAAPNATINYGGSPYCKSLSTPQSVTLTGTTGGTFSSTAGLTLNATTGAITPSSSTAGTYTVTYTIAAAGGCPQFTTTATVTFTAAPAATISYAGSPYCSSLSTPQAVTLTGNTGGAFSSTAGLTLNATTGAVTPSTSTAGTYTVTYTIAASGGCPQFTTTATVTITAAPTASITYGSNPYCSNQGLATPTFSGTTGGTYSASPAGLSINATTGIVTLASSTPGIYTVTYTIAASGGCSLFSTTANIEVRALENAGFNYGGPTTFCVSGTNPNAVITGTPGGTFSASPAGLVFANANGTINLAASTVGSYTVTYTTPGAFCGASSNISVAIVASPSANFSYAAGSYCTNASNPSPVYGPGASAGVFSATPAGLSINSATGVITLATSAAGTYTVTNSIAASGGCAAAIANSTVTITQLPAASIGYTSPTFCNSVVAAQPVTITGTTGGTFSSVPAGLSINATTGAITPSTSTLGTYTISYTIAAGGGCSAVTATTTVSIVTAPSAIISYAGSPYCSSLSTAQAVTFTGTVGGTYSSTAGLTINASTGAVTPSTSTAGTYTVTYSIAASGGCPLYSTTTQVTITQLPAATITYAGSPFCKSLTTAQPVTQTGTTGGTYSASPAGLSINATTGAITPSTSTAGTYTVTYTIAAANGCGVVTANASVTVTTAPSATISYAGSPYCSNLSVAQAVTLTGTTGGTYSSTAGLSINATTGAVTPSASTAGTYTVTYSIAASGGCPLFTTTTQVTITQLPVATITYTGSPFCKSLTTAQTVTQTGTIGGTYSASPAGLSINPTTGAITPSSSTAGTYTVTYTIAAANGCGVVTTTASVTITAIPTANISYAGSPYCSSVSTAQAVTFTGTTGGTYSSTAGLTINATTGAITPSTSTAGVYTVTYTIPAQGGCSAVPVTTTVTITAAPSATITYSGGPFCAGGGTINVTRTGTAGGTYTATGGLSINASTGAINLATAVAGNYTVTYTVAAAGGCAVFTTATVVTVNALSIAPTSINANRTSNCGPTTVNLTQVGGILAPGASWKWYSGSCGGTLVGTGATITNIPVNATTTFYVRAEGGVCGSSNCASLTVTIFTVPTVSLSANKTEIVFPETATLTATATPAAGNTYTWLRNGNVSATSVINTWSVNVDSLGSYAVRVTTPDGCIATSAAVVINPKNSDRIWLYPNPSTGRFRVRYFNSRPTTVGRKLVVTDMDGRRLYIKEFNVAGPYTAVQVDVTALPKGTYTLTILRSDNEMLVSELFVKQ